MSDVSTGAGGSTPPVIDSGTAIGLIGSAATTAAGLIDAATSSDIAKANQAAEALANAQNLDMQKANLQWQKDLQAQLFMREDNAVQRRVADLKAAGLSPVLAAGSAANAGPVVQTQAPQARAALLDWQPKFGQMTGEALGSLVAGLNMAQTRAQIDKTAADTRLTNAQASQVEAITPSVIAKSQVDAAVAQATQADVINQVHSEATIKEWENEIQGFRSQSAAAAAVMDQIAEQVQTKLMASGIQVATAKAQEAVLQAQYLAVQAQRDVSLSQVQLNQASGSLVSQSADFYRRLGVPQDVVDKILGVVKTFSH